MKRSTVYLTSLILILLLTASSVKAQSTTWSSSSPSTGCVAAANLSEEAQNLLSFQPEEAESKLRQAVGMCNTSASLYYNWSIALFRQGRYKDAEAQAAKAIELNPNYAKALNALAFYLVKGGGDTTRARSLAQKAVQLDPRNKDYTDTLEMITGNVDLAPKTSISRPDAIAILIGNRKYKNPGIPEVKYAGVDAEVMKRYLIETFGYDKKNIIVLNNATYLDFRQLFGDDNDHKGQLYKLTRKDRSDVFIFYSGHGAPDTDTKKAYIVPTDADPTYIRFAGYSLDTLYQNLAKLSADKNPASITVVLDSCFSGGYNDGMLVRSASPIFIEASTPLLTAKNTIVFTSSRGNQISSWYTEKNHGLFTYFFLKTIKNAVEEGKPVSAQDIEKGLTTDESVNDYAGRLYSREQEPQVFGDKGIVYVK